jgi:hypothetical protein
MRLRRRVEHSPDYLVATSLRFFLVALVVTLCRHRRHLAEFDFRYTNREATGCNDSDRTTRAIAGTVGRRLMYARPNLARA